MLPATHKYSGRVAAGAGGRESELTNFSRHCLSQRLVVEGAVSFVAAGGRGANAIPGTECCRWWLAGGALPMVVGGRCAADRECDPRD